MQNCLSACEPNYWVPIIYMVYLPRIGKPIITVSDLRKLQYCRRGSVKLRRQWENIQKAKGLSKVHHVEMTGQRQEEESWKWVLVEETACGEKLQLRNSKAAKEKTGQQWYRQVSVLWHTCNCSLNLFMKGLDLWSQFFCFSACLTPSHPHFSQDFWWKKNPFHRRVLKDYKLAENQDQFSFFSPAIQWMLNVP